MRNIKLVSNNLKLAENGIWYSKDRQEISYPSDGNRACFAVEDASFWFKHRNNCILSAVKSYPPIDNGPIFDIGGGNGFVSSSLAASGFDAVLVEPGIAGAYNAKARGLSTVICATTDTAQFKPQSLPAVGLFDVLEHIEDDLAFLKSLKIIMKDEAQLYITVPAYSFLWSDEDIAAGHYRRYTRKQVCKVIERAGFEIEFSSYFFRFLPLPIVFLRVMPFRLGLSRSKSEAESASRDHVVKSGIISKIMAFILNLEIKKLEKNKAIRFGGSCLIVAKKR